MKPLFTMDALSPVLAILVERFTLWAQIVVIWLQKGVIAFIFLVGSHFAVTVAFTVGGGAFFC